MLTMALLLLEAKISTLTMSYHHKTLGLYLSLKKGFIATIASRVSIKTSTAGSCILKALVKYD